MESNGANKLPIELEKALQKIVHQDGKTLVDYETSKGCKPGDNYIGEIIRVVATVKKEHQISSTNYIFKCPPANKDFREGLKTYKFVKNEEALYSKVVPALNRFFKEATKNDKNELPVAKYFYSCSDNENDVLVLDDLSVQGFKMTDKIKGLDVDHCVLAMRGFGRFHAVSLAMQQKEPQNFFRTRKLLKETLYFDEGRNEFATIHFPCDAAIRMMQSRYPERVEELEKFKKVTTNYFDNLIEIVEAPTPLAVITHGDCWVNNILFKYDEYGKPADLRFVDFQLSRFGSPALDLSYLLYNSCQKAVLDKHWDLFFDAYVSAVNEALDEMGAKNAQITRYQIDQEMRRFGRFGIASALTAVPFFVTPTEDQPKLEGGLVVFDNFHKNTHKNLNIRDRLTDMVMQAIERNIL